MNKLTSAIQSVKKISWVVSYDNVDLIRRVYSERRKITYQIGYSANIRSTGSEIMVFSDDLVLPRVGSPLSINGSRLRKLVQAA